MILNHLNKHVTRK